MEGTHSLKRDTVTQAVDSPSCCGAAVQGPAQIGVGTGPGPGRPDWGVVWLPEQSVEGGRQGSKGTEVQHPEGSGHVSVPEPQGRCLNLQLRPRTKAP